MRVGAGREAEGDKRGRREDRRGESHDGAEPGEMARSKGSYIWG